MRSEPLCLFSSHYSLLGSILTLEEPGKTKAGNPTSIFDLALTHSLKHVIVVDNSIGGFIEGFKSAQKAKTQFIFGLKLCVCADMADKTDESLKTESNVIIFVRNSAGYSDLIKIHNRAATDGFHHKARADWKLLKTYWTANLTLALPTYSSFIFKNALTFSNIVPDFPCPPTLFREIDSGLPFASLIDEAVVAFGRANGLSIQDVKSVYYARPEDYDAYATFRAIGNRGEFQRPNVDHMCSDAFCFSDYLRLAGRAAQMA